MSQIRSSLGATGNLLLADTGWSQGGTWVIQLTGTWVGTVKVQGIVKEDAGLTLGSDAVDLAIVNATSGSTVAGGTGVTANGIYFVRADGLSCQVNFTRTSGTLVVTAQSVAA